MSREQKREIHAICEEFVLSEIFEAEMASKKIADYLGLPNTMSIYIFYVIASVFDSQDEDY